VGWWGVSAPPAETLSLPDSLPSLEALLLLPTWAIWSALKSRVPQHRVALIGDGGLATMVGYCLDALGSPASVSVDVRGGGAIRADLLVVAESDSTVLAAALAGLSDEGTALAFVPPWAAPGDMNLYPELHRRSLRLDFRRWHTWGQPPSPDDLTRIAPVVHRMTATQTWLRDAEAERAAEMQPDASATTTWSLRPNLGQADQTARGT
jgi:hypothetical protein